MRRGLTRHLIWMAVLVLLVLGTRAAIAGERVALVIGNGDYQHVQRLANPRNDAGDVAKGAEGAGLRRRPPARPRPCGQRWRAVKTLARRAKDADAALFFYAGHGVQKDRLAYLIPTDAMLDSEVDLPAFAVRLNELPQRSTASAARPSSSSMPAATILSPARAMPAAGSWPRAASVPPAPGPAC